MSMAAIGLANLEYALGKLARLRALPNPHRLIPAMIAEEEQQVSYWRDYTKTFRRDLTSAEKRRFKAALAAVA